MIFDLTELSDNLFTFNQVLISANSLFFNLLFFVEIAEISE